jgi:polysaccharide biosynthesis transport protein
MGGIPESPEAATSLVALWRIVLKNWALASAVAIAVALAVTFYTLAQTELYLAKTTIQIDPRPPRPLGREVQTVLESGEGAYWNNKEYFETQFNIIRSRKIAELTVRELGLHKDGAFIYNLAEGAVAEPIETTTESAAQIVLGRLTVSAVKDSRLGIVSYVDANPQRAQKVLTVLIDNYIQQNLDNMLASTTTASEWLRGQLGKLKTELELSEMALHNYQKDKDILSMSLEDQTGMFRSEMERLNQAVTEARARREEIAARRAELEKVSPEDPAKLPAKELLDNNLLQDLRRQHVDAIRERDSLLASGLGSKHPTVEKVQAQIVTTKGALQAEVENIKGSVARELASTEKTVAGLSALFERAKTASLQLNLLQIEYNRLRRSKENNEKLYSLVLDRTKESDLQRAMGFNNIHVIDSPLRPKAPVSPNIPVNISFGIVAGLALGLAAAFGRDRLDRSIKRPEDIEAELGVHFIGLVPQVATAGEPVYGGKRRRRPVPVTDGSPQEFMVFQQPRSGVAEAARAIRTNIMFMSPDQPIKVMLVTSAGPSEGKTTIACFLATAMAQAGSRVLLVDCDMRRPRLHRVFKRSNAVGITTALLDPSTLDDLNLETGIPNLSMLPTGPIPPNPAELLHSERFTSLVATFRARYDRVIFDSPPIAPVTDAVVLATHVDGTLLVVRALKTSKDLAKRGVRLLNQVGARVIGAVINAVDVGRAAYGYYQYYYYRSDQYAADPADAQPPEQQPGAGA